MHLYTSRPGLARLTFDVMERTSRGPTEEILAAFNLGVAAATTGDLLVAEMAFTRALSALAVAAPRDKEKVHHRHPSQGSTFVGFLDSLT